MGAYRMPKITYTHFRARKILRTIFLTDFYFLLFPLVESPGLTCIHYCQSYNCLKDFCCCGYVFLSFSSVVNDLVDRLPFNNILFPSSSLFSKTILNRFVDNPLTCCCLKNGLKKLLQSLFCYLCFLYHPHEPYQFISNF